MGAPKSPNNVTSTFFSTVYSTGAVYSLTFLLVNCEFFFFLVRQDTKQDLDMLRSKKRAVFHSLGKFSLGA